MAKPEKQKSAFDTLLKRLVRVPKPEIDAQEEKYREKRAADDYKDQRRPVVPVQRERHHE
jgi:hypothetical protein